VGDPGDTIVFFVKSNLFPNPMPLPLEESELVLP